MNQGNGSVTWLSFIAGILFAIGMITDFFDGYLARKWECVSDFGKIYDPVADKLLVLGNMVIFTYTKNIYLFFAVPLIIRDVLMDLLRLIWAKKKKVVAASKLAKWKTVTQMISILLIFFVFKSTTVSNSDWTSSKFWVSQSLIIISLIFSYLSFFQYLKRNIKR